MRKWFKVFIMVIILLAVGIAAWFFIFSKPIHPVEPARSTLDSSLSVPMSTIRIPIEFQLKDLEKVVNDKLKGIFLNEWIAVGDKKKDSINLTLERTNPIRFAWMPGELSAKVPLRINFRFKKVAMGFRLQNDRPIVAEVVLDLKSKIKIDHHWGITSATTLQKMEWEMEPSFKIAFVNVNLRKVADNYIEKNQDKITRKFDSLSHALLDTRKMVEKIWNDIQRPLILRKASPQIGLSAHTENLQLRWNENQQGNISGVITLKAKLYSWFGQPDAQELVPLPNYQYAEKSDESLELFVLAKLPYDQLNHFTNSNIEKIRYTYQSYTIGIRDAAFYGSGQELALMMHVKGALRGKVYLIAQPYFDTLTQMVGLRNLRYDLNTEEALLNTADWMLHDQLISILADTVKKNISEELNGLPKLIEQGVAKGKTGQKLTLTVDSLSITSYASLITRDNIQWIFRARGRAGITLDKKILEGKIQKNKLLKGK